MEQVKIDINIWMNVLNEKIKNDFAFYSWLILDFIYDCKILKMYHALLGFYIQYLANHYNVELWKLRNDYKLICLAHKFVKLSIFLEWVIISRRKP